MFADITLSTFIIIFVSLVIAVTLHEAMHAFTSHWLGDDTAEKEGRISLNPIRHVDLFGTVLMPLITLALLQLPLLAAKPVPFNPNRVKWGEYGAALVGIAGPLTNLLLAFVGAALIHLNFLPGTFDRGALEAVYFFVKINVALFVFNMIPIPPLDGSRVLYAFAPESIQEFMAQMERYGFFILIFLLVGVPGFIFLLYKLNNSVLRILFL